MAVAQVVMNRVFSGYYPADVCRAVYQNANRKLGCQFTFACDNIRDVVTEPEMWKQATRIAADMLDGRVWDEGRQGDALPRPVGASALGTRDAQARPHRRAYVL